MAASAGQADREASRRPTWSPGRLTAGPPLEIADDARDVAERQERLELRVHDRRDLASPDRRVRFSHSTDVRLAASTATDRLRARGDLTEVDVLPIDREHVVADFDLVDEPPDLTEHVVESTGGGVDPSVFGARPDVDSLDTRLNGEREAVLEVDRADPAVEPLRHPLAALSPYQPGLTIVERPTSSGSSVPSSGG